MEKVYLLIIFSCLEQSLSHMTQNILPFDILMKLVLLKVTGDYPLKFSTIILLCS